MKKNKLFGMMILIISIMLVFFFTACDDGSGDNPVITPTPTETPTPTAADFTISGTGTVYFDGDYKSVAVAPKTGKTGGAITVYYEGADKEEYPKTTNEPLFFGTYAVTFDVAAATGWNEASNLSAGTLTVSDGTPNTPTGVSVAIASATSLKVSWTTVTRATSYKVYYITEGMEELALAGTVTGNSFTHTGLTLKLDDIYFYYVTAVNTYGESDYSTFKSVVIDKPVAPQTVEATATSSSTITLRWSSVTGASNYKIWYSVNSENNTKMELPPGTFTGTSTSINSATANTTYYFFVKAVNAVGESDFSPTGQAKTFASNYTLGLRITDEPLALPSGYMVQLQWNTTNNPMDNYYVYRSVGSPDNFQYVESKPYGVYTMSGLASNTTYYFYVKHYPYINYMNVEREGHSEIIMVRTGSPPPPPPPTPPAPLPPKATTPPSNVVVCTKCDGVGVCSNCEFGIYETKYGPVKCPLCKGTYRCPRCKGLGKY